MTSIKNILVASAVSTVLALGTAHAADKQLKPLEGISFHAGTKHAVGYFLNDKKACKLVLTLADDANFAPTRVETAIEDGKFSRHQLAEGKSLEFACQAEGHVLSVKSLEATAAN